MEQFKNITKSAESNGPLCRGHENAESSIPVRLRGIRTMIVVDGRTDSEKLRELLTTGVECSELDFKETLNLSKKEDELHFVKDAVSMFNRYPGGYLIIGATNDGKPSERSEGIDWKQFDPARLADKIAKYVDAPLRPISAVHEIDGHTYCLICCKSLPDGLPVPFSRLGQYPDSKTGKQIPFIREGEITRRDGAQNRYIEYAQWAEILRQHDSQVREEEARRINALVDRVTDALGRREITPPLVPGMSELALSQTLAACFEQGEDVKLLRFVNQLALEISRSADTITEITAVATHALSYRNDKVFSATVDALYDYYFSLEPYGNGAAQQKLLIVVSSYQIGSAMVLAKRWDLISPFTTRQSRPQGNYIYASWIRDCQVESIRNGAFEDKESGTLISLALDQIKKHPTIMPEIDLARSAKAEADGDMSEEDDLILDLLCSFDFIYCLCVAIVGKGSGGAYPSCVAFSEKRISSVVSNIFGDRDNVRKSLFPGKTDDEIADGLRQVYQLIGNEAMRASRYVWGFDETGLIGKFLRNHPSHE